ncbi:MAG: anti-sigma factor [Limisphaerales bacterium]
MIDREIQLKLQGYLDGELPGREARNVAEWLDRDPEARALFIELQHTRSLLAGGELERPLSEAREFYWSKIEREILQTEGPQAAVIRHSLVSWWLKWAVPAAAVIALFFLVVPLLRQRTGDEALPSLSEAQEIETPLQHASFISFRSEADGMSVVWLDTH